MNLEVLYRTSCSFESSTYVFDSPQHSNIHCMINHEDLHRTCLSEYPFWNFVSFKLLLMGFISNYVRVFKVIYVNMLHLEHVVRVVLDICSVGSARASGKRGVFTYQKYPASDRHSCDNCSSFTKVSQTALIGTYPTFIGCHTLHWPQQWHRSIPRQMNNLSILRKYLKIFQLWFWTV